MKMSKQINLLPPIDQKEISIEHSRQSLKVLRGLTIIFFTALPLLLFSIVTIQSRYIRSTQEQINTSLSAIKKTPGLDTMLTVKNGLAALPKLYQKRVLVSDIFKVLPGVSSTSIQLTGLTVNSDGTVVFSGSSNSYNSIYKFFEALKQSGKNADPSVVNNPNAKGHFSNLKLEDVGGISGGRVAFKITGNYNRPPVEVKND